MKNDLAEFLEEIQYSLGSSVVAILLSSRPLAILNRIHSGSCSCTLSSYMRPEMLFKIFSLNTVLYENFVYEKIHVHDF